MKKIFNSLVSLLAVLTVITFFSCTSPSSSNDSDVSATSIVNSMKFGWNLGNTLDACNSGESWNTTSTDEIDWGLKNTATDQLFQKLKDSGIKSVRIPISWHNHVDSNLNINSEWMKHVKNVVDMAYSKGLYVIINIHHDNYDGDSLGTNAGFTLKEADKQKSLRFVESIWNQVAAEFKYYDEHLVFETLNEPRLIGDTHEWNCTENSWTCSTCKTAISIINELNQKAVDTIRSAGGNNANRVIMFPSYVASPYAAINAKNAGLFKIPSDSATGRLVLSVHMYTPYNFAMNCTASEGAHSNFTESDKTELSKLLRVTNQARMVTGEEFAIHPLMESVCPLKNSKAVCGITYLRSTFRWAVTVHHTCTTTTVRLIQTIFLPPTTTLLLIHQ